jgi:predicted DNA-binding protein with PD1-like motif
MLSFSKNIGNIGERAGRVKPKGEHNGLLESTHGRKMGEEPEGMVALTKGGEAFYHESFLGRASGGGRAPQGWRYGWMEYSEAREGRVFILRLEHGEIVHEQIEAFAREQSIGAAKVLVVGGAAPGSTLIAGTESARRVPLAPIRHVLDGVHDVAGTGTIFPDEAGYPVLHMHVSCGRGGASVTGCVREGLKVWLVMEAVITEIIQSSAVRVLDETTGIKLLSP